MYVKGVERSSKRSYTSLLIYNFLNIQWIFNPQKAFESWDLGLSNHTIKLLSNTIYVGGVESSSK